MILPVHALTLSVAGFAGSLTRRQIIEVHLLAVGGGPTLDRVPYVTMCNIATLNAAMRGGVLDLIEVGLLAVGAGPTLDFADAMAFLAGFETVIEKVRRQRLQ